MKNPEKVYQRLRKSPFAIACVGSDRCYYDLDILCDNLQDSDIVARFEDSSEHDHEITKSDFIEGGVYGNRIVLDTKDSGEILIIAYSAYKLDV